MSNIVTFNEMEKMALSTAKSGLFGLKSEHQALTLMLLAQSENMHPIKAIMEYDIINGKPSLKATTILARFQQSGGKIEWIETSDKKAIAKFTHEKGGTITIEWTIERANKAGLLDNPTWKKYPNQMLRARCIPEGVRAIYPACLSGLYSVEENSESAVAGNSIENNIVDVEVVSVNYKKILANKLEVLQLTKQEIKQFAELNNLNDNENLLIELCDDAVKLEALVREFENKIGETNDS